MVEREEGGRKEGGGRGKRERRGREGGEREKERVSEGVRVM